MNCPKKDILTPDEVECARVWLLTENVSKEVNVGLCCADTIDYLISKYFAGGIPYFKVTCSV